MSNVNLCRLWYIFPPDDQELKPHEFEQKVTSFVRTLSMEHKLAVLDFLIVQYVAFQSQLEVMLSRTVLSNTEHQERRERLVCHEHTLRKCRRAVERTSRPERICSAVHVSSRRRVRQ